MKTIKRPKSRKELNHTNRKKTSSADPCVPPAGIRKLLVCDRCHIVNLNERWYEDAALYVDALKNPETERILCPACRKIIKNFPGGIVTLKGDYISQHRQELTNLIKSEEERARGSNPLERIIAVQETGSGTMVISTTDEKLAQRLGRAVKKAFNGDVSYRWSDDNKVVRVEWIRES